MLTREEITVRLETANLRKTAKAAGVHANTLWRVKGGANVSYDVIKKLSDHFLKVESGSALAGPLDA